MSPQPLLYANVRIGIGKILFRFYAARSVILVVVHLMVNSVVVVVVFILSVISVYNNNLDCRGGATEWNGMQNMVVRSLSCSE